MDIKIKRSQKLSPEERKEKNRLYMREWYHKHPEKQIEKREKVKEWKKRVGWKEARKSENRKVQRTHEYRLAIINFLIERDGINCGFCGKPVTEDDVTIDHIVPVGLGGVSRMENFRVAHRMCNYRGGLEVRKQIHGY